ncbi:MAG: von Willebrand factor type A domain-containing protein [Acidobacteria bacterium OLB17]|nr:MAG: von Willebrand factor type A domain-containing protein [Acidobacteria bacterium OLB17]MCZ2390445.1 VWA domain-containing protein [Acidobacteriota bacterium]
MQQIYSKFRRIGLLPLMLLAAAAAYGQAGRVQPTPVPTPTPEEPLKISTQEIKLNVLAFDEKGSFFKGVTADDLVIREDNILHQPASVRYIPANVLVIMDTGGELRSVKTLDKTRRIALALINSLRAEDKVAVMSYANKPELLSGWTLERAASRAAVNSSNFGTRSAFVAALDMAAKMFAGTESDNNQLVLITDGTDSSVSAEKKSAAFDRLRAANITVHVLSFAAMEAADIEPRAKGISKTPPPKAMPDQIANDLPNGARDVAKAPKAKTFVVDRPFLKKLKAREADLIASEQQLEKLAENTNGEFIGPMSIDEMEDKTGLVAQMIDSSYVVTYVPKMPVSAEHGVAERHIEVTSKRRGLIVQAKRNVLLIEPGTKRP